MTIIITNKIIMKNIRQNMKNSRLYGYVRDNNSNNNDSVCGDDGL